MRTDEFRKAIDAFVEEFRQRLLEEFDKERFDKDEKWITVNGTHVLLNENGEAQSGGKLEGKKFPNAKSEESKPSAKMVISPELKPRHTDYDFDLEDGMDEFIHKNIGNRKNPKTLYSLYHEVEDNGGDGILACEDEYFKTRLNECTKDLKEISRDEADEILYDNLRPGTVQAWFREYNHEAKEALVYQITANPEVHNAALNVMYDNYKYECKANDKEPLSYDEFLVTPVTMYRGGSGKEYKKAGEFSSYTFNRKAAESFTAGPIGQGREPDPNGVIYEAKIRPIDTYGSVFHNGESEIMVPRPIAPNKNRDSIDGGNGISDKIQSLLLRTSNNHIKNRLIDIARKYATIKSGIREDEEKPDAWITLENGQHVPLDEDKKALGGVEGALTGKDFSDAETENDKVAEKEQIKAKEEGEERNTNNTTKETLSANNANESYKSEQEQKNPEGKEQLPDEQETESEIEKVYDDENLDKLCERLRVSLPENATRRQKWDAINDVTGEGAEDFAKRLLEVKPKGRNKRCTGWGSETRGRIKFIRHQRDGFQNVTFEQYTEMAKDLLESPCGKDIDGFVRIDGSIVRFNMKTHLLAVGHPGDKIISAFNCSYDSATHQSSALHALNYFRNIQKKEEVEIWDLKKRIKELLG